MDRQSVRSSNIASIGYDISIQVLEIEFRNGGIYQYVSVPIDVHRDFLQAPSYGKFFHANIRGRYLYGRIA